jgi:hypothetical protein
VGRNIVEPIFCTEDRRHLACGSLGEAPAHRRIIAHPFYCLNQPSSSTPSPRALDQKSVAVRHGRVEVQNQGSVMEPTFFQKHRDGLFAIWRRDAREWWRQHYLEKHGVEPPEGWWWVRPGLAMGGQIAPGLKDAFDSLDQHTQQKFFDEMERRYRDESRLPARGEGWISQTHLAHCVEEALPGYEVVREARPGWLGLQRLDVYVPALGFAIEYQGVQHFEPVDLFGGEEGYARRVEMDERKREACRSAGVLLIEWLYDSPVSVEAVLMRLRELALAAGEA